MAASQNLIGKTFGFLTVIALGESTTNSQGRSVKQWLCKCDCGTLKLLKTSNLNAGNVFSCGCKTAEMKLMANQKHGMAQTPIYNCWANMKQRCYNVKHPHFDRYGGRGIRVCERWLEFSAFYHDMGEMPENMSIDRIDNNGNYEPDNCKWSTQSEQNFNRGY